MAQPEYVPVSPGDRVRVAERLPTPDHWAATRPAEVRNLGVQPSGHLLGVQGPDQGYAYRLARLLDPEIVLGPHEDMADATAGCVGVALRRAAMYSRAPIMPDVRLGFGVWGFLAGAPAELVEFRRPLFEGIAHHYDAQRGVAERVPDDTLRMSPEEVLQRLHGDAWRLLLGIDRD